MNKQITGHQLYALTALMSIGGSILVSSATVAGIAKQDSWLAALMAICYGLPVLLIYYYLGSKYPGTSLLGIVNKILGKWIGAVVCAAYVVMFIIISTHVPWYNSSVFGRLLHETPANYINVFFIAGIVIAVLYGIEVFARLSEVLITIVLCFSVLLIILILKDIKTVYMTPILESGVVPPMKGSLFLSTYITFSTINVLMIFPRHISDMKQAKKALIKGFLVSGGISFATIGLTTLVLGSALTSRASFPTLMLAAQINIGVFVSRLEYVLTMIWLLTQFVISLVFFYSALTGLSEMLGLKNHKKLAAPFGLLVLVMSEFVFPNAIYQANWVNLVYTPLITTFGLLIPLMLLIVYFIRAKLLHNKI